MKEIEDNITEEMREEELLLWNKLVDRKKELDRKGEEKLKIREINNNFMRIIR